MTAVDNNGQIYFTFEEVELFVGNHKALVFLTVEQKVLFFRTYVSHMKMMWEGSRKLYTLDKLLMVEWKPVDKCLIVTFENGDWWHYNTLGEWF